MQSDAKLPGPGNLNYLDFELEIGPGSGREYPVSVIRSPGGEARETMRFPFDKLALESRLQKLQIALLRSGGTRRRAPSPEEQSVQDFGGSLFNALLTGEARNRYDVSWHEARGQGKGLRLKLRIQPPELAALPWEFLYDPRQAEYVCLSRDTPVVRYLELPQPIQPLTVTLPLRILGMIASPRDLPALDIEREKQRVEEALKEMRADGIVDLTWLRGQTWRDLQRAMRSGPWHIFHFIGHGGFDRSADEGLIALMDEEGNLHRFHATQLGRLLADHHSLRLALLNSCEGARGSERDIFSSTAAILVRRGIPAVLAMQYEITDAAAIEFARALYEALADGLPVDAAVAEARKAVSLAVTNTVEWGTPVLYMRCPDGALFDLRGRAEAKRQAQERMERLKHEQEERAAQEKLAGEEAERQAREQAAQRQAREDAERLEQERRELERERVSKAEAERAAREKVDREEAERKAREEAAQRRAREEAEQLEQERRELERERVAKAEAERKAREKPVHEKVAPQVQIVGAQPSHPSRIPASEEGKVGKTPGLPRRLSMLTGVGLFVFLLCVFGLGIWALSGIFRVPGATPTAARTDIAKETAIRATITQAPAPMPTNTAMPLPTAMSSPIPQPTPTPPLRATPIIPTPTVAPPSSLGIGSTKPSADGATMVYVPAGEFTMGSTDRENQKPIHPVYLDEFWIDKFEVTNAQYAACLNAGACKAPWSNGSFTRASGYFGVSLFNNYPILFVGWDWANAYCAWAGKRLPTEAEWEKAARGTDRRNYPWGNTFDWTLLNSAEGGPRDTMAAGSFPSGASPYGAMDMAGNVWEWTADWYDGSYYANSPRNNPKGPGSGKFHVMRGGSWTSTAIQSRTSFRFGDDPGRTDDYGFRCVQ